MNTSPTRLISLQFALFFRDLVNRPDLEFKDLNESLLNIFDAMPTYIPMPPEIPNEVPLVMLRSESNEYTCNISRSRIDLHVQRLDYKKDNDKLIIDFNSKVKALITYILNKKDVIRFGMVSRYFHESNNAVDDIKKKYFKDSIGEVAELSLRYNKRDIKFEWIINDMIDITAAEIVIDGVVKSGVFIQRDINNTQKEDQKLSLELLSKISQAYAPHINEQSIKELL